MAKLTLADLASLANQTTAITTINANSALIETALENTLSRDGTSPNTMGANLDMNSNRITNLPAPAGDNDPVRSQDLTDAIADLELGVIPDATLDTDGTLTANSDVRIASQKATKTYADTKQPLDSDLTAIAALTTTSYGRALLEVANTAALTALLNAFTGDSGSGGVKGLVPAPAAADAAGSKFLKADGNWTILNATPGECRLTYYSSNSFKT